MRPDPGPKLSIDAGLFHEACNRRPFLIEHRLASDDRFSMDQLLRLARRRAQAGDALHWSGRIPVDSDFDHLYRDKAMGVSLDEAIERIAEAGSFVVINYPENDPEYAPLLSALYQELAVHSDPLEGSMTEVMGYVFLSSPGSTTPYHMDRELNFLLQIRGEKWVHLWDPNDRAIMSEQQIEQLFARPALRRPGYLESFETKASVTHLLPGLGVHHPFIAPHMVKNGPEVSISLALTYRTRGSDRVARAYKANHFLRQLGLPPRPVGSSRLRDRAKAEIYGAAAPIVHTVRRVLAGAKRQDAR